MSILEHLKKINIWALGVFCLVLGLSLAVGSHKLRALEVGKQALVIDSSRVVTASEPAESKTISDPVSSPSGQFVASKTGKKYYSEGCSGAKALAEKNKVYFKTQAAAKAAGYTPSSTCKDLKAQ